MITKLIIRRERPEIYTHLEKFLEENLTTKTGESCNLHEARWLHGFVMGHGVGSYLGLDEIGRPNSIIISYLFNRTF